MDLSVIVLLTLGAIASKVRLGSLYLGALGALLVGTAGGYYGVLVPQSLIDFGILTLIFVIGVQAGPRFLRTFRKDGAKILFVACGSVAVSAVVGALLKPFFPMPFEMFLGAVAGGLSSAAAFAALVDIVKGPETSQIILGYSASYPISTIMVLFFVPAVLAMLRTRLEADEAGWKTLEPVDLERKAFKISNPKLVGKTIGQIEPIRALSVNFSRVIRKESEKTFSPDHQFELEDIIVAVGTPAALAGVHLIVGEEVEGYETSLQNLVTVQTYITSFEMAGKTLQQLKIRSRYGVTVTRVRRDGVEFVPRADMTIEFADMLTVIGEPTAAEKFSKECNPDQARLDQSQLIPLMIGLAGGVFIGSVPVAIYGSNPIKLGPAGGVFLISMLLGYVRGLGRIRLYLPVPASNILRDFGLLLFIVGTGTLAGKDIDALLTQSGLNAFLLGGVITVSLLVSSFFFSRLVKFDSFGSIGAVCGSLNASSALPQAGSKYLREVSSLFYASVYPVALVIKIIVVQIFVMLR